MLKNFTVRYEEKSVLYVDIPAVSDTDAMNKFEEMVEEGKIDFRHMEVIGSSITTV